MGRVPAPSLRQRSDVVWLTVAPMLAIVGKDPIQLYQHDYRGAGMREQPMPDRLLHLRWHTFKSSLRTQSQKESDAESTGKTKH
jgi:hypothetical protein